MRRAHDRSKRYYELVHILYASSSFEEQTKAWRELIEQKMPDDDDLIDYINHGPSEFRVEAWNARVDLVDSAGGLIFQFISWKSCPYETRLKAWKKLLRYNLSSSNFVKILIDAPLEFKRNAWDLWLGRGINKENLFYVLIEMRPEDRSLPFSGWAIPLEFKLKAWNRLYEKGMTVGELLDVLYHSPEAVGVRAYQVVIDLPRSYEYSKRGILLEIALRGPKYLRGEARGDFYFRYGQTVADAVLNGSGRPWFFNSPDFNYS